MDLRVTRNGGGTTRLGVVEEGVLRAFPLKHATVPLQMSQQLAALHAAFSTTANRSSDTSTLSAMP